MEAIIAPDSDRSRAGPGLIGRLLARHRESHGTAALVAGVARRVRRAAWKGAALATYYPSVAADVVRWRMRPFPTVERVVEGERRFDGGRYAVFLVFQPVSTPWYVENALTALADAGINVLLVCNHPLAPERLAAFRRAAFRVMIRNNAGLDIGGYRDGFLALREQPDLKRMLLLNDSVYFFEDGLSDFLTRLSGSPADVCAAFENHQFHHHLQSFCLSLSARTIRESALGRFFERYVPVNSRRWAIHRGEVALSRVLASIARSVDVLYRAEDLGAWTGPVPAAFAEAPARFVPIWLRAHFARLRDGAPGATPLDTLAGLARDQSQVHVAGFLFRAILRAPLLKRDLVFRHQFSPDEAAFILRRIGDDRHLPEIVADLTRKGDGGELRGLQGGRFAAGMI